MIVVADWREKKNGDEQRCQEKSNIGVSIPNPPQRVDVKRPQVIKRRIHIDVFGPDIPIRHDRIEEIDRSIRKRPCLIVGRDEIGKAQRAVMILRDDID